MSETQVETERKYEGASLPGRLDGLPGVALAEAADPQELDAVYYDTPDRRLLRRRITLRRRSGGDDAGWHLKLPLGADSRQEVRVPLDTGGPQEMPADLALRVAVHARGATLRPVAHLRTHRARRLLRDEHGRVLAELTEDRVAAQVLDADRGPADRAGGGSAEIKGWTEVEAELAHGSPALLDRIDTAFTEAGLTLSPWPSKLARALGRDGGAHAPAEQRRTTAAKPGSAGALVLADFRALLDDLLLLDPAVRRGEVDSVHRMRVTARRLRSLLKAHRRLFDRRHSDPLATGLRRLGRTLGGARDQEVLGELLVAGLPEVPAWARGGTLRGLLTERHARGYRRAWERAVAELDSAWYFTLLDRLDAFAADPPLRRRAGTPATGYLAHVLRREQRRTLKRLDRALRTAPGPRQDQALHRARKAAKRARYTAESAHAPLPRRAVRRAHRFGARMKELHKVLGVHQDSVVARRALITLATDAEGDTRARRHAFACGVLHERQRQLAESAVEQVPRLRERAARRRATRLR
ncbi:CYTH and CHAD domain-containing protein [Kitasatospora nipponensis]|uniref:CYTH and CHAD domain-containing protein n=1 Tax=Kitasatospora nipponensis TaxID=258049 RepID=A0ABN1WMR5_9ACTN